MFFKLNFLKVHLDKKIFKSVKKRKAKETKKYMLGSTETRTRIAGFRVQSANHYTIEPIIRHGLTKSCKEVAIIKNTQTTYI